VTAKTSHCCVSSPLDRRACVNVRWLSAHESTQPAAPPSSACIEDGVIDDFGNKPMTRDSPPCLHRTLGEHVATLPTATPARWGVTWFRASELTSLSPLPSKTASQRSGQVTSKLCAYWQAGRVKGTFWRVPGPLASDQRSTKRTNRCAWDRLLNSRQRGTELYRHFSMEPNGKLPERPKLNHRIEH
jgi:hypothetical protein